MRRSGLTTRDVGRAVDLDHSAVARWLKGTRPYPSSIAKLATFFEVPVEVLTDEGREIPPLRTVDERSRYLTEAPIKTAVQLANAVPGDQSARQKAFEEYLAFLHSVRAAAEAGAPGDPAEARRRFDHAMATWLAARDGSPAEIEAAKKKLDELKNPAASREADGRPKNRRQN